LKPLAKRELRMARAVVFVLMLNIMFGLAFYIAEKPVQPELTRLDSIWWSIVTMTTVGYGDISPQTFLGRFVISYACFFLGIGSIGYILGTIAESFFNSITRRKNGMMPIKSTDHVIICNCPSIPRTLQLVRELRANPNYRDIAVVVVTDVLDSIPDEFKEEQIQYYHGSPLDEEVLLKANVKASKGVIIQAKDPADASSDAHSFATGTLIEIIEKETGKSIQTVVELVSEKNERMLLRSNIDGVVPSGAMTDQLIVQEFCNPGIREVYEQLVTNKQGSQFYIVDTQWIGKRFQDLQIEVIKHAEEAQLVGIMRDGDPVLNPGKDLEILNNDQLILLAKKPGQYKQIEAQLFA
jgi:voltage-gated potassium channel